MQGVGVNLIKTNEILTKFESDGLFIVERTNMQMER